MAAVVYGNSPRHSSRHHQGHMLSQHSPYHTQPASSAGQHHSLPPPPVVGHHHHHSSSVSPPSQIITPPTSYLSSATTAISSQQSPQQQSQQPQYYHHHSQSVSLPPQHSQTLNSYHQLRSSKRKSAVELLAESKPFYVKSETVLDRQQQLLNKRSSGGGSVGGAGGSAGGSGGSSGGGGGGSQQGRGGDGGSTGTLSGSYMVSPSRTLPSSAVSQALQQQVQQAQQQQQQQQRPTNRRSASSGSDLLQTKLRKLLNASDSKETIMPSPVDVSLIGSKYGQPLETSYIGTGMIGGGGITGGGSLDDIGYIQPPKNYQQQLTVHPEQPSDVSVFFPSAFLSPQSLPPHPGGDDDLYLYGGLHDSLVLTDDYRAISPPAEYAEQQQQQQQQQQHGGSPESKHPMGGTGGGHSRYNYQRSYSHSQAVVTGSGHHPTDESDYSPTQSYNINSHKSLPDLHSQSSRHSPHSEALSCCSRGNRSNRSGSSFNRDSGGSSGHYTHHSEPCCKQQLQHQSHQQQHQSHSQQQQQHQPQHHLPHSQLMMQQQQMQQHHSQHYQQQQQLHHQANDSMMMLGDYRRDSGSSTQHSGNSYYAYGIPPLRYDCIECRAKIREEADCLLNFTTPEVPEAFQDGYSEKQHQLQQQHQQQQQQQQQHHQQQQHALSKSQHAKYYDDRGRKYYKNVSGPPMSPLSPVSPLSPPDQPPSQQELSPPLGTFKRQKCLRFKNRSGRASAVSNPSPSSGGGRCGPGGPGSSASAGAVGGASHDDDRRPILRSKSDISDRYWNRVSQQERGLPVVAVPINVDIRGDHRDRRVDRGEQQQHQQQQQQQHQQHEKQRSRSDSLTQLERFFDRLGLDEETYDRFIAPKGGSLQRRSSGGGGGYHHQHPHSNSASSDIHRLADDCPSGGGGNGGGGGDGNGANPGAGQDSDESSAVFFSDVSTIDSTKLPDSTVDPVVGGGGQPQPQQQQQNQGLGAAPLLATEVVPLLGGAAPPLYRTSEPPSIIERNARIIKWLCNCKKMQLT
ncbi:AF4/FMR2 family member lilli [Anopheles nili]|uniref:AF4/FMR2 family member lilli n=1 Tax=Anopheles nili TaxID=185578 RepID=UPI00237AE6BC|nr:AF4/FMR2 family member lilli [Anopheles nili]